MITLEFNQIGAFSVVIALFLQHQREVISVSVCLEGILFE